MQKRLFVRLALAVLFSVGMYALAAPAPAALAASQTTNTRESGLSASASYTGEYETTSGTVTWTVDYMVSTGSMQTSSGKTITGPAVWAHIGEFQTAEQSFQAFAEQPTPVPASDVQIDKTLHTAALLVPVDVTVIVQDGEALPWGTAITLHVEPTQWTGVGDITHQSFVYHERTSAYTLIFHGTGRFREATVTGDFSYTSPWNNVAVGAADATTISGQLSDTRNMTISVQHVRA